MRILSLLFLPLMLVGCGDKSELELKLEHELAMEREKTRQIAVANQVQDVYNIEHEYEYETDVRGYSEPTVYSEAPSSSVGVSGLPSETQTVPVDEGYSGSSMALAAVGGMAAGYLAGEMLNNGMKSYQDESGKTHYTDKNGKPVSKQAYEDYKKQNPKVTKLSEKVSTAKNKAKELGKRAVVKTKDTYKKVKNSETVKKGKEKARQVKDKAKAKYSNYTSKPSRSSSRSSSRRR